jgi:K+-sensing histidine kinase KdpD
VKNGIHQAAAAYSARCEKVSPMQDSIKKLPPWLLMLTGILLVTLLGYVDYLTGDYSLLIFYVVPITLEAWFLGYWGAVVISLLAGLARFVSDYYSYSGASFKYWNSLQDMLFLLMVGLLIATVKKLLTAEQNGWDK